jgi:hypothetical protein
MLRCLKTFWSISRISSRLTGRSSIKLTTTIKYRRKCSGGGWKDPGPFRGEGAIGGAGLGSVPFDSHDGLGWAGHSKPFPSDGFPAAAANRRFSC